MPQRALVTAFAAAISFTGAFAIVHAAETAPISGLSASAVSRPAQAAAPTPTPAPAPATVATQAPTPVPVVQRAASAPVAVPAPVVVHHTAPVAAPPPPPPAPVVVRNLLTSDDGTLHTAVGVYSDCSGHTELTHAMAAIDTCMHNVLYFVGHNAGVFTPLMHIGVGAIITYHDGAGTAHVWRVSSVRADWTAANGVPPVTSSDVVAQFQTCVVPDGSVDRILDVVPA
ncbi:MAG TPA: hypothetical protein VH134_12205 [Candidatus Dormibacteraeota bacterium]|jgi:hypothetical protein|nr:hypothetical protein [Candidatus Dormibacteraeota bacterium]